MRHQRQKGPDIGEALDPQRQKASTAVERELGMPVRIAPMVVAEKGLDARRDPMHRPANLTRGVQQSHVFRIARRLHAETAADVLGQHQELFRRKLHGGDHLAADLGDALRGAAQDVAIPGGIVACRGHARLERGADQALIDEIDARNMGGVGEDAIDLGLHLAFGIGRCRPVKREITGRLRPQLRGTGACGLVGIDHRAERLVIHDYGLGAVRSRGRRFGDHQRHRLPDMHNPLAGKRRPIR